MVKNIPVVDHGWLIMTNLQPLGCVSLGQGIAYRHILMRDPQVSCKPNPLAESPINWRKHV